MTELIKQLMSSLAGEWILMVVAIGVVALIICAISDYIEEQ